MEYDLQRKTAFLLYIIKYISHKVEDERPPAVEIVTESRCAFVFGCVFGPL